MTVDVHELPVRVRRSIAAHPATTLAIAAVVAVAALYGLALRGGGSVPLRLHIARPVTSFTVSAPIYHMASWDPQRIDSFTFVLGRATRTTIVKARIEPAEFTDSCRLGPIEHNRSKITCSYPRRDAPMIADASALTVVASS